MRNGIKLVVLLVSLWVAWRGRRKQFWSRTRRRIGGHSRDGGARSLRPAWHHERLVSGGEGYGFTERREFAGELGTWSEFGKTGGVNSADPAGSHHHFPSW